MAGRECVVCGSECLDGYVCARCTVAFAELLREARSVLGDLDVARSRMARRGGGLRVSGSVDRSPMPVNERAAQAHEALSAVLRAYDLVPVVTGAPWLVRGSRALRGRSDAGLAWGRIRSAVRTALGVIDLPARRWYAGQCSAPTTDDMICPHDLYARVGTGHVTCSVCGTVHDVLERRTAMLRAAEDVCATAADIARAVARLDDSALPAATIRQWARRGLITPSGYGDRGRPLYRLGDVLDVVARMRVRSG